MQEMEQVFRELRSQITDPSQNRSSLELIQRLEENSVGAQKALPPFIERLPQSEQPRQLAAYKALMTRLINEERQLRRALIAGNNSHAATILKRIADIRNEGHAKFRPNRLPKPAH